MCYAHGLIKPCIKFVACPELALIELIHRRIDYRSPIRIDHIDRIVSDVGVAVPGLRIRQAGAGQQRIRGSKATLGRGEVPGHEVIQAGFGIPFFAGELHLVVVGIEAGRAAAGSCRDLFSKRKEVAVLPLLSRCIRLQPR